MTAPSMLIDLEDIDRQAARYVPCGQCSAGLGLVVWLDEDADAVEPFDYAVVVTHSEGCAEFPRSRPDLRAVPTPQN